MKLITIVLENLNEEFESRQEAIFNLNNVYTNSIDSLNIVLF